MSQTPKSVLVVDDEFAALEVLALLLSAEGFRVLTAADGQQALSLLDQSASPIALVITDLKMPRMDGRQLCERMLANPKLGGIPVFLVSETYRRDIPQPSNVVAFFDKPLLFTSLLKSIRRLLDGAAEPGVVH